MHQGPRLHPADQLSLVLKDSSDGGEYTAVLELQVTVFLLSAKECPFPVSFNDIHCILLLFIVTRQTVQFFLCQNAPNLFSPIDVAAEFQPNMRSGTLGSAVATLLPQRN